MSSSNSMQQRQRFYFATFTKVNTAPSLRIGLLSDVMHSIIDKFEYGLYDACLAKWSHYIAII